MINFQAFGDEPPPKEKSSKSKFTIEEDNKLIELVEQYGEDNWKLVSSKMDDRNERQVHDRWEYYLSPNLKKEPFSAEEDALLFKLRQEFGPKWVKIAQSFPGRTDVNLKNRYNFLKRRDCIKCKNEIKTPNKQQYIPQISGMQVNSENPQITQYQNFLLYQQQMYQQALLQARMQGFMDAQRQLSSSGDYSPPTPIKRIFNEPQAQSHISSPEKSTPVINDDIAESTNLGKQQQENSLSSSISATQSPDISDPMLGFEYNMENPFDIDMFDI